jgi:hypothetical protein
MPSDRSTLDDRRDAFHKEPCTATARRFVDELFDYWSDDLIGRDTLRDGLIDTATRLTGGLCDLGSPVTIKVT